MQTSHTWLRTIWPNAVRATVRSSPVPSQRPHVSIGVPGSAPLPLQRSHGPTRSYSTCTLVPRAASWRLTSA